MNTKEQRYAQFALVREMMETPGIIRNFKTKDLSRPIQSLKKTGKLFLTGEGSSRIFPAKNAIYTALKRNTPLSIHTEGSRQAAELNLSGYTIFGASNSGKTKEVISLFHAKKDSPRFGLTANMKTPLEEVCEDTFVLDCGKEDAVAATKSVIEQGLFYHTLLLELEGSKLPAAALSELADKAQQVLELPIPTNIVDALSKSPILYFAGRNNGAAEEATLKTNEITRKKSAYLEGTYAVHGIEEVMNPNEVVIVVDPFKEEETKFKEVLVDGVGMTVVAISARETMFPTVRIPSMEGFDGYLHLMACWNLLVEIGITIGINLDKPVRARKIGNEFIQQ